MSDLTHDDVILAALRAAGPTAQVPPFPARVCEPDSPQCEFCPQKFVCAELHEAGKLIAACLKLLEAMNPVEAKQD